MSGDIIQARYEDLDEVARRFVQQSQLTADLRSRVDRAAQALEHGGWEGCGSTAFFAELNTVILPALQRLSQVLEEAQAVTLAASEIMRHAEADAAALFGADGSGASANGSGPAAGEADDGGGFLGGVGDFFTGMWDETKDMASGLAHMVLHPIDTAQGLAHAVTHPDELWDALKQPYVEAWESGHPWQAIGRGTMFAISFVLGAKGADKAAKAAKAARAVEEVAEVTGKAGTLSDAATTTRAASRTGETAESVQKAGQAASKASPAINVQKQAGHVKGTPQYTNRVKQGKPTSAFEDAQSATQLTQEAWQKGSPVAGRPNVRDHDFGRPIGSGPRGGSQSRVRVHQDAKGQIHGHPVGPETPPSSSGPSITPE
jgi:WXG100 family type VII secretion target